MPIDIEKYLHHLDGFDLTDAQKAELIHSVSEIMESFVDQAFGAHPVQQSMAARAAADSNGLPKAVGSKDQLIAEQFGRATGDEPEGGT